MAEIIYISSDEDDSDEDDDWSKSIHRLFSLNNTLHSRKFPAKNVDFDFDEDDDDCVVLDLDECMVLDGDPDKPLEVPVKDSANQSSDDDLLIVAEKGQIACRDYPHARHLCVTFPFNTSPHEKYCDLCHCYVCDTQAPCVNWGTGKSVDDHCHSTDKGGIWGELRKSSKQVNVEHPVVNPSSLIEAAQLREFLRALRLDSGPSDVQRGRLT